MTSHFNFSSLVLLPHPLVLLRFTADFTLHLAKFSSTIRLREHHVEFIVRCKMHRTQRAFCLPSINKSLRINFSLIFPQIVETHNKSELFFNFLPLNGQITNTPEPPAYHSRIAPLSGTVKFIYRKGDLLFLVLRLAEILHFSSSNIHTHKLS